MLNLLDLKESFDFSAVIGMACYDRLYTKLLATIIELTQLLSVLIPGSTIYMASNLATGHNSLCVTDGRR